LADGEIACPKCKRPMQEGFPLDRSTLTVGEWVEGRPEYFARLFLKLGSRKKRLPITTYRCTSCGYLESYAK
jgi:hypothetical protein